MKVSAIIPAAGQGVRMGAGVPKQFLLLNGKPILHHTLQSFQQCDEVDEIVIVMPANEIEPSSGLKNDFGKIKCLVAGGAQRQDSVCNGFDALDPDTDIVVVHDGVRPFASPELIRDSIRAARDFGAVITAIPVSDTIKKANEDGLVEGTVAREGLWRVQTPQTFRYELLKEACDRARQDGFYGTDEGALIENLGRELKIIPGSELNIKITRSEDLVLGEHIAAILNIQ